MKRMLTEYRVGPRSSVPSCGRFLCLPSQGAQDAISEAAERRCRALPHWAGMAASFLHGEEGLSGGLGGSELNYSHRGRWRFWSSLDRV